MKLPDFAHKGLFSLIAFDDVLMLAEKFGLSLSDDQAQIEKLEQYISSAVQSVSSASSGVQLFPPVGFPAARELFENSTLIFELSKMNIPKDPLSVPVLSQYGIEACANMYAATKLELYYNPTEEESRTKKQIVSELYDSAQQLGTPFIIDLIVYLETTEQNYEPQFLQRQLDAVQDLRSYCDAMILEYPLDALNAVTVTAELDVPWLVSGRNTSYEDFKSNVRTALESGASGYVIGEQLLPEKPLTSSEQLSDWFIHTARDRAMEMKRILEESSQGA